MKVAYLTWNEQPWAPLLRRQVEEMLVEIAAQKPDLTIRWVAVVAWYEFFRHRKQLKQCAKRLREKGVHFSAVPSLVPFPIPKFLPRYVAGQGFVSRGKPDFWTTPFIAALGFPLFLLLFLSGYRVFHGRSYPAVLSLWWGLKLFTKVGLVFDPRSDFPEENVTQGAWSTTSRSFRVWKKLEKKFLKRAQAVISIVDVYGVHFKKLVPQVRLVENPNNVNRDNFHFCPKARQQVRDQLGVKDGRLLVYLGGMSPGGWHDPTMYAKVTKTLLDQQQDGHVLFLIPTGAHASLSQALQENDVAESRVTIKQADFNEVYQYLSAADQGLFFLAREKMCLATKVPEYLCCGLPILVNENATGAAELVRETGWGQVLPLGLGGLDDQRADLNLSLPAQDRRFIESGAADRFSNQVVAKRYLDTYQNL